MAQIRVWTVEVDGKRSVFDSLDVAIAYLSAEVRWNWASRVSLESSWREEADYRAEVDAQDGGGDA